MSLFRDQLTTEPPQTKPLTKRGFPPWSQTPIPHFQPSAGGLLALADLGTIANRTAIVGGSSWLDSLLLAPGLHYQQAADALVGAAPAYDAVEIYNGKKSLAYRVTNPATIRYLQRLASTGHKVVVDVAAVPARGRRGTRLSFGGGGGGGAGGGGGGGRRSRRGVGQRATIVSEAFLPR